MTDMRLRDVTCDDLERLHALNEQSLPHVNSLTTDEFEWLFHAAGHFRMVDIQGSLAGFLLGLRPELDYGSLNYAWFSHRYADFVYIDRLAVDTRWRRQGIASALYADVERHAHALGAPLLACEVNLNPPNEASLAFHRRHGFSEVGRQETEGGRKTVSLMIKPLATATAN